MWNHYSFLAMSAILVFANEVPVPDRARELFTASKLKRATGYPAKPQLPFIKLLCSPCYGSVGLLQFDFKVCKVQGFGNAVAKSILRGIRYG